MFKIEAIISIIVIFSCSANISTYNYESIYKTMSIISIQQDMEIVDEVILKEQHRKIDNFKSLQNSIQNPLTIPNYDFAQIINELDVNRYFNILTHLTLEEGYKLGYLWNGSPCIYSFQTERIKDYKIYNDILKNNSLSSGDKPFLNQVKIEDTAEGYFEFVLLTILSEQFLLFGHANYNDLNVICDSTKIDEIQESLNKRNFAPLTIPNKKEIISMLNPIVKIYNQVCSVEFLTFSKWSGFVKEKYYIERKFPHKILNIESKEVLNYDCGSRL